MKRVWHILGITILVLLIGNLLFWSILSFKFGALGDLNKNGLIIGIKPYAWAFVHGNYIMWDENTVSHVTTFDGGIYRTLDFSQQLYDAGYTHVWTSACETGDYDMIEYNINGTGTYWPDWIDRNKVPGKTVPVWVGLGFIRISI